MKTKDILAQMAPAKTSRDDLPAAITVGQLRAIQHALAKAGSVLNSQFIGHSLGATTPVRHEEANLAVHEADADLGLLLRQHGVDADALWPGPDVKDHWKNGTGSVTQ